MSSISGNSFYHDSDLCYDFHSDGRYFESPEFVFYVHYFSLSLIYLLIWLISLFLINLCRVFLLEFWGIWSKLPYFQCFFFFLLIQALCFSSEYLHSCSHTILYSQTQYSLRNKWDSPKLSWLLGIRSHDEADVCSESLEWSLWNHYLFACVGLNFSCHAKGFWWYLETLVVEWFWKRWEQNPAESV